MGSFASSPRPFTVRPARTAAAPALDIDLSSASLTSASDETDDCGWLLSSFELRHGLQISEQPMDTLPGELQEAFRHH